ncbi:hypothetical protein QCA50_020933 [Cerrena zonata]|uniref:Ubiquitin carboxyl-terminal hydrolase n=1 Tax=Cerrena zonata TaxID=2478898 RepID=A0AAW0FHP2_9APHY
MGKNVIPLESNPEIFNGLSEKLGLSPVLQFQDVYSITEPELLAFLPQPIYALIMLFPITGGNEKYRIEQDQGLADSSHNDFREIKWFKQTMGNAYFIIDNSILNKTFLSQLDADLTTEQIENLIETLESNINLDENFGNQGQTEAPNADSDIDLHFITFIKDTYSRHIQDFSPRPLVVLPSTAPAQKST